MDNKIKLAILASLTLGLIPYVPEPHIWGKLKWIAGGAVGMRPIDWLDTLYHGAPWVVLIFLLIKRVMKK